MPTPLPKPPKIKTVTLNREVKCTKNYQSCSVSVQMTAEVNDGSIEETKKLLRTEVDKFIQPRIKECWEYLGQSE